VKDFAEFIDTSADDNFIVDELVKTFNLMFPVPTDNRFTPSMKELIDCVHDQPKATRTISVPFVDEKHHPNQ